MKRCFDFVVLMQVIAMSREIVGAPSGGMAENSASLLRICASTNAAFFFARERTLASAGGGVIAPFATGYGWACISFDQSPWEEQTTSWSTK